MPTPTEPEVPDPENPPETIPPPTPMVAPLAESDDRADLFNEDGTIKGSPANEPGPDA